MSKNKCRKYDVIFIYVCRLLVLREPIDVIYTHLDSKIGNPEEIEKILASPEKSANLDCQYDIPLPMDLDN